MRKNKAGWKQNGFTMLTLDDDVTITEALKAYFEAIGYQVDTESDPIRALERMREKHYDILLLDFLMEPLCGDEVVAELRTFDRDIFIILLTGHKELAPPLHTVRELDIQGYYEKSDRFDQLALLVESCTKSIRQMRIVSSYRDGLSLILSASQTIHRLAPLEDIMGQILYQARALAGTDGLFLWVDPGHADAAHGEDIPDFTRGTYRGGGHYQVTHEAFCKNILPGIGKAMTDAITQRALQISDGYLIAPLISLQGCAFGVMVVDALSNVSVDLARLLEMYAHQSASALNNAMLYDTILSQNAEITEAYRKLNGNYIDTISALRLLVDAKDIYTRGHSDRVSFYGKMLAAAIGLDETQQERVRVAGLFHDVGKVGISEQILTKVEPLTDDEYMEIRKHPGLGARILAAMEMFTDLPSIVHAHHERIDGRGYPRGLSGEDIPLEARIIAIADSFDAMTSDRHYRKSLGFERAIAELRRGAGTQFDATLVEAFLGVLTAHEAIEKELAWTYEEQTGGAL